MMFIITRSIIITYSMALQITDPMILEFLYADVSNLVCHYNDLQPEIMYTIATT